MHALTRDCPLTCLEPLLPAQTYHALQAACPRSHPTVGHVADLHRRQAITSIRRIGAQGFLRIETCLAGAGLIEQSSPPDPAPAGTPEPPGPQHLATEPPPIPAGWSGVTTPARRVRGLFVE
jgi:hypothetical protein